MNILNLTLLSLLALTGPVPAADAPAVVPPVTADTLSEALPILQAKYIDFKALGYKPGDKLSDLVARSNGEISLSTPATSPYPPPPILTANLPGNILYWRLATFTPPKSWLDLGTQLEQARGNTAGIILDLRSNLAPDNYAGAAQVLSFLVPADITFMRYLDQMTDESGLPSLPILGHKINAPIVVLTNNQTSGAAEALAGFLQADGALLVGRPTSGKAAFFGEQKLSSGQVLRFTTGNISKADGIPLFGHPVVPDISLNVSDHNEKAALILIKDNQILDVIQESAQRHRMTEASLVQGQDPEWDDYLASLEQKPVLLSLPVIHDVALISALDSLKAIRLSERTLGSPATTNAATPTSSSVQ